MDPGDTEKKTGVLRPADGGRCDCHHPGGKLLGCYPHTGRHLPPPGVLYCRHIRYAEPEDGREVFGTGKDLFGIPHRKLYLSVLDAFFHAGGCGGDWPDHCHSPGLDYGAAGRNLSFGGGIYSE